MKKKLLLFALILLPMVASAAAVEINGIYYELISKNKTAEVTSNPNNYTGDVVIPESVTYQDVNYSVTSIGEKAFFCCYGLTAVNIPNSVTSIGDGAFYYCSGLTSITIPNSVTSIGGGTFAGCSKLTSITIGNSVTSIGGSAFYECSGLTSITIPNSVTSIESFTFSGCSNLTSVNIPNSVTSIEWYAFQNCSSLTSVTIPNSVTSIEWNAFYGCSDLTSVTIGNGIKTIGSKAFASCKKLENVYCYATNVPNTQPDAFDNSYIESTTLIVPAASVDAYKANEPWNTFKEVVAIINFKDDNVKAICVANWDTDGDGELNEKEAANVTDLGEVFKENRDITSFDELRYFTGLTSIGNSAFRRCEALTSIIIPSNVTDIKAAFLACTSLKSVTIPASVTDIHAQAFSWCTNLAAIHVEEGNSTFDSRENCNAIITTELNRMERGCRNTVFPNSVTIIGSSCFEGSDITTIDIPSTITIIRRQAFRDCNGLTSIVIPNSVTSIEYGAFNGCDNLNEVYVNWEEPVVITEDAFSNRTNATLYVPAGSKAAYEAVDYWKEFKEIVEMINIVKNSNLESTNVSCFYSRENYSENETVVPATIVDGAGKDGSRGIMIQSVDNPSEGWNTQFFLRLPQTLPAGTKYRLSFDYKASQNADISIEFHAEPSDFLSGVGDVNFTTEWQHFESTEIITEEQSPADHLMRTIAFSLAHNNTATTYYFDNIIFEIDQFHCSPAIAFADAKVKELCVANWDTNGDGELSVAEAADVKNLGLVFTDNQDITSFNELQYFTGLTAIGDEAFQGCQNLASVTFPEGLESIGGSSFGGAGLTSIKFPKSLNTICGWAFQNCASLASIDFNECAATIHENTFVGCHSLTEVTVPATCTMKEWNHFGYCKSLESATILAQAEWVDGILRNCPKLETVVLGSTNLLGASAFAESPKIKTITIQKLEATGRRYEYVMGANPADCRFVIPEGTAQQFLKDGYRNLSDMSALSFVKGVYEAETARVQTMADGIDSGDKTALAAAITTANGIVNAAEDYPTIFAQIDAVNTAAKAFLATATLAENTDVTAAAIIDPNSDSSLYTWNSQDDGIWWWWQGSGVYTNGDVTIDRFVEKWKEEQDGALADGVRYLFIGNLPAGRYRLECDAIATWQHDASVEVTGVSLFAGDQQTPIATENEKPQHFSVDFTLVTKSDCKKVGIQVKGTNANWVAFDNVRLTYLGSGGVEPTDISTLANAIYADAATGAKGSTTNLTINLKNEQATNAYSFDLKLPEGVTVDSYTLSDRHNDHSNDMNYNETTGVYSFAVLSIQSKEVKGNDGAIMTLKLKVADNVALGDYAVKIQNAKYSLTDGSEKVSMPETISKLSIENYVKGDVNGDNDVDIADAVCIVNHVVGKQTPKFNAKAADVNGDGDTDIADAVRIVNLVVGKISALAPRFEWNLPEPE